MRTTHTLQFYCRQSKASKKTQMAHIELSIIINQQRVFIQLPREEYPDVFRRDMTSKRNNQTKEYCNEIRRKFNDIELDLMRNNIPLTASALREYYRSNGVKTYNCGDLFEEYLQMLKKREGKDLTHSAYKKYQNAFDCFLKFCPKETEITAVNTATIEKFYVDCNTKYQRSTTCGIMTKVHTAFNFAKASGKINTDPFYGVKVQRVKKDIEYLDEDEIQAIYDLDLTYNKSLAQVRDAFILQCSCGLAYIDLYNLKRDDIQIDDDGTHYIIKNRHKTNIQFTTIVSPLGVEVLKRNDYELHIISNQKYNYYLKTIQSLAGIKTNLTTHIARKTFATNMLNKHNVRLEVVSKALGHSTPKITAAAYAKVLDRTIISELKAAF